MDRTFIHVIPDSWIAWTGEHGTFICQIKQQLFEITNVKFLGIWSEKPSIGDLERLNLND